MVVDALFFADEPARGAFLHDGLIRYDDTPDGKQSMATHGRNFGLWARTGA